MARSGCPNAVHSRRSASHCLRVASNPKIAIFQVGEHVGVAAHLISTSVLIRFTWNHHHSVRISRGFQAYQLICFFAMAVHSQMRTYRYFHHYKIVDISVTIHRTHIQVTSPDSHCKTLSNKPPYIRFCPQLSIWQVTTALLLQHVMLPQPEIAQLSFFVDSVVHVSW